MQHYEPGGPSKFRSTSAKNQVPLHAKATAALHGEAQQGTSPVHALLHT